MAQDIVIRFRGDEGNRKAFFDSIARGPQEVANAITAANTQLLRARSGINVPPQQSGYFLDIQRVRTELNAADKVIKTIGQIGISRQEMTASGSAFSSGFFPIAEIKEVSGNFDELVKSINNFNTATGRLERSKGRLSSALREIDTRRADRTQLLRTPRLEFAQQAIEGARLAKQQLEAQLLNARVAATENRGIVRTQAEQKALILEKEILAVEKQITNAVRERNNARAAENRLIAKDVQLNALKARETRLGASVLRAEANLTAATLARNAALAGGAVTTVPQNYSIIPPQLRQILERGGLRPAQGQDLNEYLQKQKFNAPRYDLVRDVTRFSGEFNKTLANGQTIVADWSAEVDKSGKVVTRFGGQLSGASQIVKQISRDFQKVIEWTVATTVVFGALQYTIEQLRTLQELDFALQKFAITAQQSPREAQESFGRLAEISRNTATPLLEIIGAADDIALATQRAGQSMEQWRREIFQLTESVGVFTNLTGIDTVQATDLLTATMKQLRLTAADIPAILSKITAVAGGQSQAISDITKGLSVMAEAGRVAGLSLDQQIATVQVLSQVTSKTPAEVATAFKNLVGSLGSPAALKGLAQFNIGVRTQQGELRNILDIYGEISDKIKSGVIPAADVQGLIRAISGGPRRAPDAAALLAAIEQIITAQRKSAEATNEAAIANAKAIDTTKAKIIQLQSTIDAVTFEKFGGEFKNFVNSLVTLLTTILETFNKIPTGIISGAIQIGLFFIAVRAGARVLSFFGNLLREITLGFTQVGTAATRAAGQIAMFNTTQRGGLSNSLGAKSSLGKIGLSAALGAGISALSGGSAGQIIGGGLQGLGIGLLALPDPSMLSKLLGVGTLALGTILQFTTASRDAAESQTDLAVKILDSFAAYKEAATIVNDLTAEQKTLAQGIDELTGINNKTASEIADLSSKQKDYTKGVLEQIDAQIKLTDAREILLKTLPAEEEGLFRSVLAYQTQGEEIDKAIRKYQELVLARAGINVPATTIPTPQLIGEAPYSGSPIATGKRSFFGGRTALTPSFDLSELDSDFNRIREIFTENGEQFRYLFSSTGENIGYITRAIEKLAETQPDLAAKMLVTANAFFAQNDAISQLNSNMAAYQSYIDAISVFNPQLAAEGQRAQNVARFAVSLFEQQQRPTNVSPDERDEFATDRAKQLYNAQLLVSKSLEDGKFNYTQFGIVAREAYNALGEEARKYTTYQEFVNGLVETFGLDATAAGVAGVAAFESVSEAAGEAAESLREAGNSLGSGITDRLAKLQADLQAGIINKETFNKLRNDLTIFYNSVTQTTEKFADSLQIDPGFAETLQAVQPLFADIIGLENAAILSSDEFVLKLLELGDTYGLNGKQLQTLSEQLVQFYDLVKRLNELRVNIPIGVSLDLSSVRAALAVIRKTLSTAHYVEPTNPLISQMNVLLELEKVLSSIDSLSTSVGRTYGSGSGTNIGSYPSTSASKAGPGTDISELDLPEEIAEAINSSELIKQAIANAKKLQSQIPGATKEASNDLVILLDGLTKVMQVSGVKSEYLRRALDELAEIERKRLEFDTKADTIRRIRVGAGDFSAIANVPVNTTSGVSLGGAEGPINITLNLNGTVLTPAQLSQFADLVASALKRQLAGG